MKKILKLSMFALLFMSVSLLLWNCQTENEFFETNNSHLLVKLQSNFNTESFKKALPYDFEVNWNTSSKQYSEELQTFYYEFPIVYTSSFNPEEINKEKSEKNKYNINYKVFVTENKEEETKYYILKFYEENLEKKSYSEKKFMPTSGFTGFIHLLDNNGGIVFAKKFKDGIEDDKKFYNKEFKNLRIEEEGTRRVDEVCVTITTYHYTDWYNVDSEGVAVFHHTSYEGFTTGEVCESYWLPSLHTSGGGGSGSYSNNGNGGIYNDCVGSDCKYEIDDAELEIIIFNPNNPINNVVDYLKCYDTTQPATFTVYVTEPNPGSGDTHNGTFVGVLSYKVCK